MGVAGPVISFPVIACTDAIADGIPLCLSLRVGFASGTRPNTPIPLSRDNSSAVPFLWAIDSGVADKQHLPVSGSSCVGASTTSNSGFQFIVRIKIIISSPRLYRVIDLIATPIRSKGIRSYGTLFPMMRSSSRLHHAHHRSGPHRYRWGDAGYLGSNGRQLWTDGCNCCASRYRIETRRVYPFRWLTLTVTVEIRSTPQPNGVSRDEPLQGGVMPALMHVHQTVVSIGLHA